MYSSVSYTTDRGREAHALDVAMDILGGSDTSRLYRALVEERGLAVGAGASADTSGVGGGSVTVYASPSAGVELASLEGAMDEVVARFLAEGPTDAELARAKSNLAATAIYARDSQEQLAYWYGSSLAEGETLEEILGWAEQIRAVTREEVMTIARRTLTLNSSVTGYLLPEEGASE
jgi:zinc protease